MKDDYATPVREWLQKHDTTVVIEFSHNEPSTWLAPHDRRVYKRGIFNVTIARKGRESYTYKWHDSLANTAGNRLPPIFARYQCDIDNAPLTKHKTPTEYDVLSCLQWYEVPATVQGFMDEFGYDNADTAMIIRYACVAEHQNLARLFSEEEREEIALLSA